MSEVPETGLHGGGDDGPAGERPVELPLSDEDGRLLQELRRSSPPVVEAREDSVRTLQAVEGDRALPGAGARTGAGALDPVFQEPPGSDA